ncbi:MAG TPA: hypothetical protein VF212_06735 [Longimicrobiales bacterium]
MKPRPRRAGAAAAVAALAAALAACAFDAPATRAPRSTLLIGIDVSGSFRDSGHYKDALAFAARYIHGHINGHGGLEVPRALFVGAIGGNVPGKAQAFHPIHDFEGKTVDQIQWDLEEWFPPDDRITDFNAFFARAGDLIKRQSLTLAPITLVVLSDGVPDLARRPDGSRPAPDDPERFAQIDVSGLEYLARNVTIRVLYPNPPVAVAWERHLPRSRVRLWTVDHVVMKGWRAHWVPDQPPAQQAEFWDWVRDNVDYRVRRSLL